MKNFTKKLLLIPLVFSMGCSSFIKQTAIDSTGMVLEDAMLAFFEESDIQLAYEATPSNLKLLEGLIKGSPNNDKLLIMGCRFFTSYAFGFIEEIYSANEDEMEKNNDRAKAFHKRAADYGFRVLNKNTEFSNALNGSFEDFEKVLSKMGKDQVENLFWTAYAWGNFINLSKDDTNAIVNLGKVELMMRRVLELDETYYNGGPHLFYMVYYGSRPTLLGGNPEKADYHYKKAREITNGKFLMADVLYAAYYAVLNQDRELYEQVLNNVLNTPASVYPEERLTNEIAQKRAKNYLELVDELF